MDVYVKDGDDYKSLPEDYKVLSNSDLESGYIPKDQFGPAVQQKVDERFKNHVHKDKVFDDEVLVARFKEQFGGKESDLDLDKQREQWATANLKPVESELEETKSRLLSITGRLKHVEMERAFGDKFGEAFVKRIDPSKPSLAELHFGDQVDFDYGTSTISVANSQMTIDEFVGEVAADDRYKIHLRTPERNETRAKVNQDGKIVTKSGNKPSRKGDINDVAGYIRAYGLDKPKVDGWPAYKELKTR